MLPEEDGGSLAGMVEPASAIKQAVAIQALARIERLLALYTSHADPVEAYSAHHTAWSEVHSGRLGLGGAQMLSSVAKRSKLMPCRFAAPRCAAGPRRDGRKLLRCSSKAMVADLPAHLGHGAAAPARSPAAKATARSAAQMTCSRHDRSCVALQHMRQTTLGVLPRVYRLRLTANTRYGTDRTSPVRHL